MGHLNGSHPDVGHGAQYRHEGHVREELTETGWQPTLGERVLASRALTLSYDRKIEMAEKWLADKHCTLWLDWNIQSTRGLRAAAEFLVETVDALNEVHRRALQ